MMPDDPVRFLNVFMDQNNKCNLRCIMCGFSDPRVRSIPRYDMPFWLFEKIAREIFPLANYLALSCLTEPLMTRDFSERIDLLKTYPVPFTEIVTNGTLLTESVMGRMIDARISRVALSLDGATPRIYESIREGAKFNRVIKSIRRLNALKKERSSDLPGLRINHVITEGNIDEFSSFLDLAESLEVRAIDVRRVLPCQGAKNQGKEDDSFLQKVEGIKEKLRQWTQQTGVEDVGCLRNGNEEIRLTNESGEEITCRRPWDTVAIHANGDLFPCITWSRQGGGNIAKKSFKALWEGPAFVAMRKEFEEQKPGIDCLYCTMRKSDGGGEDEWFLTMLNKRRPRKPVRKPVLKIS